MGGIVDWFTGADQRDAAEDARNQSQQMNQQSLDAQTAANAKNLDFQKVLAYLQSMQGNQLNAQQLAATLSGQQQGLNQFAQLYNQDMTNRLPLQQSQLASLQALTPLMQMSGMQGYQLPTTLDTTKLQAPDVVGDFNKLSSYYAQKGQQEMNPQQMLAAFNDPEAFLKAAGQGAQFGGLGTPAAQTAAGYTGGTGNVVAQPTPTRTAATVDPATGRTIPISTGTGSPMKVSQADVSFLNNAPNYRDAVNTLRERQAQEDRTYAAQKMQETLSYAPAPTQQAPVQAAPQPTDQPPTLSTQQPGGAPAATTTALQAYQGQAPGSQVTETPGYKWTMEQANKQMMNQLAAQGLVGSGAATKMAADLGQQISQSEYDKQYGRLMNLVQLGMGQSPTSFGQQAGSQLSNMYQQGASNTAGALQNAAQNRSGTYSGLANAYGNAATSNAQALSGYYGANAAANNAYANARASRPSGFSQIASLGMNLYGMGAFGGGGGMGMNKLFS